MGTPPLFVGECMCTTSPRLSNLQFSPLNPHSVKAGPFYTRPCYSCTACTCSNGKLPGSRLPSCAWICKTPRVASLRCKRRTFSHCFRSFCLGGWSLSSWVYIIRCRNFLYTKNNFAFKKNNLRPGPNFGPKWTRTGLPNSPSLGGVNGNMVISSYPGPKAPRSIGFFTTFYNTPLFIFLLYYFYYFFWTFGPEE